MPSPRDDHDDQDDELYGHSVPCSCDHCQLHDRFFAQFEGAERFKEFCRQVTEVEEEEQFAESAVLGVMILLERNDVDRAVSLGRQVATFLENAGAEAQARAPSRTRLYALLEEALSKSEEYTEALEWNVKTHDVLLARGEKVARLEILCTRSALLDKLARPLARRRCLDLLRDSIYALKTSSAFEKLVIARSANSLAEDLHDLAYRADEVPKLLYYSIQLHEEAGDCLGQLAPISALVNILLLHQRDAASARQVLRKGIRTALSVKGHEKIMASELLFLYAHTELRVSDLAGAIVTLDFSIGLMLDISVKYSFVLDLMSRTLNSLEGLKKELARTRRVLPPTPNFVAFNAVTKSSKKNLPGVDLTVPEKFQ